MKLVNVVFFIALIACGVNFFEFQAITETGLKYLRVGIISLSIATSLPYLFDKNKGGFTSAIKLISVSILFSMVMAYLSWGQSFSSSYKATFPLMLWFAFFYFTRHKLSIKQIENVIILFGIIYTILFFFQFTHSDVVYFGWQDEFMEERGVIRINFPGAGLFFLFAFFVINKVTEQQSLERRFLWIAAALICVLVVVLQVTRQSIAVLILIYLFHLVRNSSMTYKVLTGLLVGCIAFVVLNIDNPIVKGLQEVQNDTASQGDDYIRILSGTYFLKDLSPNTASRILGNGVPYYRPYDASNYGLYTHYLQEEFNYYLDDVGIIAFYTMFGVGAVIGYLLIFFNSFKIKLPPKYQYLKYYIWYLGATCFTNDAIYSHKFLAANIIALVCYQTVYESPNYKLEIKAVDQKSSKKAIWR